jgi:riboflavin synthase
MFTGIIETVGEILSVDHQGSNAIFKVKSQISNELKVDQSVSHNGVCLTVEAINQDTHQVTAISETLQKTNLGNWKPGTPVNLERCMVMNGRLDGHIVQGHVDEQALCIATEEKNGSREFRFRLPQKDKGLLVEKGSISINGISLTVFDVSDQEFAVAIIPYTLEHTNMSRLKKGDSVNIEYDLIGKYILRISQLKNNV